jgi:hypothetical protein
MSLRRTVNYTRTDAAAFKPLRAAFRNYVMLVMRCELIAIKMFAFSAHRKQIPVNLIKSRRVFFVDERTVCFRWGK